MSDYTTPNVENLCLERRMWITARVRQQDVDDRWSEWSEPRTFFTGEYEHELTGNLFPEWEYHPSLTMAHFHISKDQYDKLDKILTGGPSAAHIYMPEDETEILTDIVHYEWEYKHYLNIPQGKFRFQVAADEAFTEMKFDQTIGSDSNWIDIDFSEFGSWDFSDVPTYPVAATPSP